MEKLLPILFIIAMFIFQSIANYRKEQEKAKKRNLGKPVSPPVPAPIPSPTSQNVSISPPPETIAKTPKKSTPMPLQTIEETDELERFRTDFDLHDAVVMAAILERPYQ